MSRLVVDPRTWDWKQTAETRVEHGQYITFSLPNGWTKTAKKWECGSVLIPCDWYSFFGYMLVTPDGRHATVTDWYSPSGELTVKVGSQSLLVPGSEIYGSWTWGGVSETENRLRHQCGTVGGQWLYRMFDESGDLLYVGVSDNATRRWREHERDKPWFHNVCTFTRERYPDRVGVELAEREAIIRERPRYNVVHNAEVAA